MNTISTDELKRMQARGDDLTIINVLPAEKFNSTRIPDAVNIPVALDDFEKEVHAAVGRKGRPVVVYCANEQCTASTKAAERLEAAGFSNVFDYSGGAEAWQNAEAARVPPQH